MFLSIPYLFRLANKVYNMDSVGYHIRLQYTNKKGNYLAETRINEFIRASYV